MAVNMFRLKKIKINVEFKGRHFSTEVQPYKTIRYVKDQAKSFFYPIAENISIYYQSKDLTSYENNLIGDYFKKRTTVALRLFPMSTTLQTETKQKILNSNSPSERYQPYTCSCNQEGIDYYCRTCKDFLCNACRMSIIHSKHNVVQVDTDNLEESAKLYAITLQADVLYNIKSTYDYYLKFQNQNFIEASARQEMFIRKLSKIQSLYNEMIKELSFNRTKAIETLLENFKQQAKKAHGDLETILTSIYQKYSKGRLRMSYEEMKDVYEDINEREKTFEQESCDALAYKVNYEINTNIDIMYNRLDEIADEVLNSKTSFGLNLNSYFTYEMIKNKNSTLIDYNREEEKSIQELDKKEEVKSEENVKKKEYKEVPTGSIQFKNRYIINAKDKDGSEKHKDNDNDDNKSKEITKKNIIEDKGYDECVNISETNIINVNQGGVNENDNCKSNDQEAVKAKKIDNKNKHSNEANDLLEMLSQNDQKNSNEGNMENKEIEGKRKDDIINLNQQIKQTIDNDNRDDEENDLLDSINLN